MEPWSTILGYITVLAWPLTVLTGLILFRKNISSLLDRVQSLKGPGGIEIQTEQIKQAQQDYVKRVKSTKFLPINEVSKNNKGSAFLVQQKDFNLDFEKIYDILLGSQLTFLSLLNTSKKVKAIFSEKYFKIITDRGILKDWTYDQFFSPMFELALAEKKDSEILVTQKCLDFLNYLSKMEYDVLKTI